MNPCVLKLFTIFSTTILLVAASTSEINRLKRLQLEPEPSGSNKKPKNDDESFATKNVVNNEKKLYIAVIGGGINAALFTHYLHELINAEVHIFNHETIEKPENSAFIVHESNKYMMEIISKFDLDTKDVNRVVKMYDGEQNPVLNFYQNKLITPLIKSCIEEFMPTFERIYDIQEKYLRSFMNLKNLLLLSMSSTVQKLLNMSTQEYISKKPLPNPTQIKKIVPLGSEKIVPSDVEKIVHSLLLLNYGQNLKSNAFAGLTSLIFSQFTGKLKRITTPIKQLVTKLLSESDKFLTINVTKVSYEKIRRNVYRAQVSWIGKDGNEKSQIYDNVVIATPEIDNIEFLKFKNPITVCKYREMGFRRVTASLKDDIFEKSNPVVTVIANVSNNSSSFQLAQRISNSQWKIVTNDNGSIPTEISSILNITGSAKVKPMALWPVYSDKECTVNATFVLDRRLFYLNAIEWASSSLEMKAIGAKNVALRIKKVEDQFF